MNADIRKKCSKVKILLTDVDGVLTDGGMYYSKDGDSMKRFFARDGMGVTLLRKKQIHTIIVTKEKTQMARKWAKKMSVKKILDGIISKEKVVPGICKDFRVTSQEIAFIGDDVNDLELLKIVGMAAAPADAIKEVKKQSDYVCKMEGGKGAFRELVDLILLSKSHKV